MIKIIVFGALYVYALVFYHSLFAINKNERMCNMKNKEEE